MGREEKIVPDSIFSDNKATFPSRMMSPRAVFNKTRTEVSDASGEVLFEAKATSLTQAEAPIYGTIDDVNAGDTLYCTTTFTFDGVTTTSTVTDVVE